jgi:hypothetical protein
MAMTILFIVQTRHDGSLSKRPVIFEGIDTLRYGSLLLSPRMTPEYFLRFFCFFFFPFLLLNGFSPWNTRAVHDRYDGNGTGNRRSGLSVVRNSSWQYSSILQSFSFGASRKALVPPEHYNG